MDKNQYIIDTSSLIDLARKNPFDVYPSVWANMEILIENKRLFSPKEVLYELGKQKDDLSEWAKKQKMLFVNPTPDQIKIVKNILRRFPQFVKKNGEYDADPWLIALAREIENNSANLINKSITLIVSEEKIIGNKLKIPFVSNKFNIKAIDIIEMFRYEGWKF